MRRNPLTLLLLAAALTACPKDEAPCPDGQSRCSGVCRDTLTDVSACGACGRSCPLGGTCVDGHCGCPVGETPCATGTGTACVDLATDDANCGACGTACGLGACSGGSCDCDDGATSCTALDPVCRDTQADPGACGDCETACTRVDAACEAGACACPASKPTECDPPDVDPARCVNTATDPQHCGGCGDACPLAHAVCDGGSCECPAAWLACPVASPTACVDPASDEANCGACGQACPGGATCSGGDCVCPVSAPDTCDATCVDKQADEDHCGTCGNACGAGQQCVSGGCCTTCPSGACQAQHANGLGGFFSDCNPLGTYTEAAARSAADAWSASGTTYVGPALLCETSSCLGRQTGSACAVWCWDTPVTGRVHLNTIGNTCVCPHSGDSTGVSPTWN